MDPHALKEIMAVLSGRFEKAFQKKMSATQKKDQTKKFIDSYDADQLVFKLSPRGKLIYFFRFQKTFMGEFEENFFHLTSGHCVKNASMRNSYYKAITHAAKEMRKNEKVKRMAIDVSVEDKLSKDYYSKKGKLTAIELVGNTKKSLGLIEEYVPSRNPLTLSVMEKKDMGKLIELELASHLEDKTSRMREIFMKPDARKSMRKFYKQLLKSKRCFVAKEGRRPVGAIGYFADEKNKLGLIATIFVANDLKGQSVSRILYHKLLEEFNKKKLTHFVGSTTTEAVLVVAKQIGREEWKRTYLLKI